MSQELIDSVKSLGKKTKSIETELGMPLNCLSGMLTGKKPIPLKWQLKLAEYVEKNRSANKPNANDKIEAENRTNQLTQAARGRDSSGVNEDENRRTKSQIEKATPYVIEAVIAHQKLSQLQQNTQMPKGLNWKEQLEWRRNNK